jgi:hypothetical protein
LNWNRERAGRGECPADSELEQRELEQRELEQRELGERELEQRELEERELEQRELELRGGGREAGVFEPIRLCERVEVFAKSCFPLPIQ